ncbi:MAG: SDR family oxidoreductase [Desulfobulbaceae bacterium]|nr:SDR family oxidoreductase [Desulfobulbaceae bacterium]
MSFLNLHNKRIIVFGLANKKSVACAITKVLLAEGAEVIHVVRSEERRATAMKLFPEARVYCCDVEDEENIIRLRNDITHDIDGPIHGLVHSIAFANYSAGLRPFHQTIKADFLQAVNISCFSLISIANHFSTVLAPNASVVTISISTTRMAAENYGYMAPIKAALESSLCFLAQSFAKFSEIRFNAVCPGLLKTSASAGIPGYVDSYLFAEQVIPRKRGVETTEAADCAAFLLSERSSGINAQAIVVDAGMAINYFDPEIVRRVNFPQA